MFKKFVLALKILSRVMQWIDEVQKDAKTRLSPESAAKDRLWLENLALDIHEGRESGWRAHLTIDNEFGPYALHILKSQKLDAILHGGALEATKAREKLTYPPVYPVH